MTFSEEVLMAYADDELDAPTRAAVDAAMASDPQIARRIARQRHGVGGAAAGQRACVRMPFGELVERADLERCLERRCERRDADRLSVRGGQTDVAGRHRQVGRHGQGTTL